MNDVVRTALPLTAAVLEEGLASGLQLGAQLYVSLRGRPVVDAALGESCQGVPMTTDTLNLWFSSGKPLTSAAVAQLWEQGRLDLDAPVASVVPEFAAGGKGAIRLRHLLNHTAGFRPADRIPEASTWEETIDRICRVPLEAGWVPGQRAGYQLFSSWFILGEMVRRVDGRSIEQYLAEEFFVPLQMKDCWLGLPVEAGRAYGDRLGRMHFMTQGRLQPHPVWNSEKSLASVRPGGGVCGPFRELGKFYEALLAGKAGLKPETLETFTRRDRVGMYDETFRHQMDWGLGFAVNSNRYGPDTVPYGFGRHATDAAFGHGGSQSSIGFADPGHQLVVAWVCNGMPGETAHQQRARRIQAAIYEDLGLAPAD